MSMLPADTPLIDSGPRLPVPMLLIVNWAEASLGWLALKLSVLPLGGAGSISGTAAPLPGQTTSHWYLSTSIELKPCFSPQRNSAEVETPSSGSQVIRKVCEGMSSGAPCTPA